MSEKTKKIRFEKLKRKQVRKFRQRERRAPSAQKPTIRPSNHYLKHLLQTKTS